jgi:hypothetical protein
MDVRLDHSGLGFAVAGRIVYRLPVAPDRYRLGIESAPFPPSTPS